ncbi:MAG: hypothetical protein RMX65_002955 [Nostoc sp. DedQUE01]|nr:hypothetical protein [Nostoc sp. DedQUE01]
MTHKFFSMFAGAFGIAIATSSFSTKFEFNSTTVAANPSLLKQQCPMLAMINASVEPTPQQEAKFTQICKDARSKIESILTPEQRELFQLSLQQGNSLRRAIIAVKLSPEQTTQLLTDRQSIEKRVWFELNYNQRQQVSRNFPRVKHCKQHSLSEELQN